MEEHFDINQALRVFDKIVTNGIKHEDKHSYQGMTAWSDVDGYTVQLSDDEVSVSIYFHNRYEFDYDTVRQLESFLSKLKAIDESIT